MEMTLQTTDDNRVKVTWMIQRANADAAVETYSNTKAMSSYTVLAVIDKGSRHYTIP